MPTEIDSRNISLHRYLSERIVITGTLVLTRPAHFGNGDEDELADLPLFLEEGEGRRAIIQGTSLAGALRNYLRERQCGYEFPMSSRDTMLQYYQEWTESENRLLAASLFGGHRGDPNGEQSPLIVDDALSTDPGLPMIERRDGVALNGATRTAEEKKKYDYELLAAGTEFDLRFELLLEDENERNPGCEKARLSNCRRLKGLALAMDALAKGEIRLGARKRRGFGCCIVPNWSVTRYRLHNLNELLGWLGVDYLDWVQRPAPRPKSGPDISTLLSEIADSQTMQPDPRWAVDHREWFEIEGSFHVKGSMMIRSGFEDLDELEETRIAAKEGGEERIIRTVRRHPDYVHLRTRARHTGKNEPVLPGTSLAGALRQRSLRIAKTLSNDLVRASQLIDGMFGPIEINSGAQIRASRVTVNEEFIENSRPFVQTRIKLDRFTAGTLETALLEEEPSFDGSVRIRVHLSIVPTDFTNAEIGLLLLVLKDLWLGDLPVGGEIAVGRGRLQGQRALLRLQRHGQAFQEIALEPDSEGRFQPSPALESLDDYVRALQTWARGAN